MVKQHLPFPVAFLAESADGCEGESGRVLEKALEYETERR